MTTKVIGLGAGGHAKVVIEALLSKHEYHLVGLLDPNETLYGQKILNIPVIGSDEQLPALIQQGITKSFVGVGSVGNADLRRRLFMLGKAHRLEPLTIIHPQAVVSPSAHLGEGTVVFAGAVINAEARIGENVIINTGAIVEHDCMIGDHAHIATGARLAGAVTVGAGAHIGAGATVRQRIKIGENAVVGAGAVVVKNVVDGITVIGIPAKPLSK
jgi:UDP-perosamine 4-acetyltransferase